MPTSNLAVALDVLAMVDQVPHDRVLDVGPGHGKYATLLREYVSPPPTVIAAVEAHAPYVAAFGLERLYDAVLVRDVIELEDAVLRSFEVVLMVDVLEHLDLDAGHDLLARIPCRIVICTPVDWFSNGPGLPSSETHRSHWTPQEWDRVAERRQFEVLYQNLGGWLARLAPLP